jgi:glycosyltransferase involved in cell wall biosynthesis
MSNKTIQQLYIEHQGKVSDKWTLYLNEYERLFSFYRDKPISFLEIGIQNGGSLEIWSKYFSNATALIGVDINPGCARLSYDEPRISVIVGDANAPEVRERVFQRSPQFDIIIDDGSHLSSDIIKSFALYFPRIVAGGVFVAEDLHCSYWSQFEGGLFDPYSSISFFKALADIINHEHWGIPKLRADILRGIFTKYGCEIDEESLAQVHSVEFLNSMCVVRKAPAADNRLGRRFIAGSMELVVPNSTVNWPHDKPYQFDPGFDQSGNPWSVLETPPDEVGQFTELACVNAQQRVTSLSQALVEREEKLASFSIRLSERDSQVARLSEIVQVYQKSTSWRITKPARFAGLMIKRIKSGLVLFGTLFSNLKELKISQLSHIRLHIDKPSYFHNSRRLFKIVGPSLGISGWCVDIAANAVGNVRVRIGKAVYQPQQIRRVDVQQALESVCKAPTSCGFAVEPSIPIGLHRMWIDIEGPDGNWIPVRRALLLRIPGHYKQNFCYKSWARIEQKRLKTELPEINRHIDVMIHKPIFTIVIDTRQSLDGWEASLQSIRKQIYPHHELRALVNVGTKLPTSLEQGAKALHDISFRDILGDFIVFIECGQSLSSNALYEFANAINHDPDLDLIYGDEDHLSVTGERCDPFHKPDWSPDYLETFNYIKFPSCFRTTIARGCFDNAHLYDLALKFTERTAKIRHVAKILGHRAQRKMDEDTLECESALDITSLQGRLNRTGRQGTVREHKLHAGCYDIQIVLKREPLVSVIIPTAGKVVNVGDRQIDLITNLTHQIRNQCTYKNIEIIVVDYGDLSERQQQTLSDQGCRLIAYAEPIFNISKKLNLGASIANGELLLLMNDDIEIILPSWIERMAEHFEKPHVGVVGAKLLYPDGTTQHVGVVHNHGNPDHVRRSQPKEEAGYYFSTCGVRNFMGVTGAVMMTLSSTYRLVGGYSEELAVSFNDIDYCLKARELGLWIVYAARAELIHMESLSCVRSLDVEELTWYRKRWAQQLVYDPYYNEQLLSIAPPTFVPCVNRQML